MEVSQVGVRWIKDLGRPSQPGPVNVLGVGQVVITQADIDRARCMLDKGRKDVMIELLWVPLPFRTGVSRWYLVQQVEHSGSC